MTYREILELYKEGKLEESRQKEVEADIEKQDAISEYLFEAAEIPSLSDLNDNFGDEDAEDGKQKNRIEENRIEENRAEKGFTEESRMKEDRIGKLRRNKNSRSDEDDYSRQFAAMINSSIRRAFIRMGVCVCAVTIIVVLLVTLALPKLTNQFFYDPSKVVCSSGDELTNSITQFDLDVATYTELFLPGTYRDKTTVRADGYGTYDIEIHQNLSWNGRFTDVSGKITRNKLTLYDTNTLQQPSSNVFATICNDDFNLPGLDNYGHIGIYGDQEQCRSAIAALDADDSTLYTAYVTLDRVYTYSDFMAWLDENETVSPDWIALCSIESDDSTEPETHYAASQIIGFNYNFSWDYTITNLDEYPYLTHNDLMYSMETSGSGTESTIPEETVTQHVISMLTYLNDNPDFYEMMTGNDENFASSLAENVQENGLNIYGYAVITDASEIQTLINTPGVAYIYAELN